MSAPPDGAAPPAAKPFTLSFGAKPNRPNQQQASAHKSTPAKRNRAAFAEDNDSDDEGSRGPQAVSGFGENGAVVADANGANKRVKKEPLVIPVQQDADWRRHGGAKSKGKNLLPPEVQAQMKEEAEGKKESSDDANATLQELKQAQYGLVINRRSEQDVEMLVDDAALEAEPQRQKTADEQAYDRLVNGEERKSNLVIAGTVEDEDAQNGFVAGRKNEEGDFRSDVAARPESSTVADYEAVPIEEFGAALLRGMGWKEGGGVGRSRQKPVQPKKLERRANLLGIGAKHAPEGLEELGAWGKGAVKGPKTRESYNPVVLKNAKTGETLTEEEKAEKDKKRKEEEAERKIRRDRDEDEGDRHERRRDRDLRDKDRNGIKRIEYDRRESPRRHRSRSKDRSRRYRSRSQERRDYDDEDRYRDMDRSHRTRDGRDRHRDKHRSRRDYERDGDRRRHQERDERDDGRSHKPRD